VSWCIEVNIGMTCCPSWKRCHKSTTSSQTRYCVDSVQTVKTPAKI